MVIGFFADAFGDTELFIEIIYFVSFVIKLVVDVEKSVILIFYVRFKESEIINGEVKLIILTVYFYDIP